MGSLLSASAAESLSDAPPASVCCSCTSNLTKPMTDDDNATRCDVSFCCPPFPTPSLVTNCGAQVWLAMHDVRVRNASSLVGCLPHPPIGWITFVCRRSSSVPSSRRMAIPPALPVRFCPQGETAITVPIDGRHNARGLDSREFSTARQSIWPRRARARGRGRVRRGGDLPG